MRGLRCAGCGGPATTIWGEFGNVPLCDSCVSRRRQADLDGKAEGVRAPADFAAWSHEDMSELFWKCLGRYVKEPYERGAALMNMALLWACHDDHGLANSFRNALDWAGVDLFAEQARWSAARKKAAIG